MAFALESPQTSNDAMFVCCEPWQNFFESTLLLRMKNRGVTMKPFQAKQALGRYCGFLQDKAVPAEHLKKIVRAGLDAPSGRERRISEIVAITDTQKLAVIRAILPGRAFIATAPAFIAAIFEVRAQPVSVYAYTSEVEDNAAVAQNLLQAITDLGYASVWLDGLLRFESRAQRIGDVIGLPAYQRVRVLLPVGVAATQSTRRQRKSFPARAWNAQSG
jgi:nitroreductase